MDVHKIRPGVAEALHVADRPVDHQVHVQKHIRALPQGFEHRQSHGNIRYKLAVHHVIMDIVRSAPANILYLFAKTGKICREYGRRNLDHGAAPPIL